MVDKIKQNWISIIQWSLSVIAGAFSLVFFFGQSFGRGSNEQDQMKKEIIEIKVDINSIKDKKVDKEVFEILLKNISEIREDVREIRQNQK